MNKSASDDMTIAYNYECGHCVMMSLKDFLNNVWYARTCKEIQTFLHLTSLIDCLKYIHYFRNIQIMFKLFVLLKLGF